MTGTAVDLETVAGDDTVPLQSAAELVEVIREGLTSHYTGELEIRDVTATVARVYLDRGRLAWVHCSGHREHLGDVLQRDCGLSPVELRRTMARCRETGERLGEALASEGLVKPVELREALRRHLGAHLSRTLEMNDGLRASFTPGAHRYDEAFTFRLEEIPCATGPRAEPLANGSAPELVGALRALRARFDLQWCGLLELRGGNCLAQAHVRGFAAEPARDAVLDECPAVLGAAMGGARDREVEAILHGARLTLALRVFVPHRLVVGLIANTSTSEPALLARALHELAQTARLWQASRTVEVSHRSTIELAPAEPTATTG